MSNPQKSNLQPGLIALHGNQVEGVVDTFFEWMNAHPLSPLEEEVILTPTHAMAEWLKLRLAQKSGVCAAVSVNLPGKVIWSLYRTILNAPEVASYSATDKEVLVWRLMRILPSEITKASYRLIQEYVARFGKDVLFKLSTQLADLFDQYQVYRADWLKSWEAGQSVLLGPRGESVPMLTEEMWQSECWRAIVNDLDEKEKIGIRPHLHDKVMSILVSGEFDPSQLPKRITLLGVNSLPMQNLAFFAALSQYTQVFIGVNSPCQFHWADIMEGREFFKLQRRRFKNRGAVDLAQVNFSEMHLHANPILSAWGRQHRDFVRQLDEFDDVQKSSEDFHHLKLDVFSTREHNSLDSEEPLVKSVLHMIQDQVRDLEPLEELTEEQRKRLLLCTQESQGLKDDKDDKENKDSISRPLTLGDSSLVFQMSHGLTRELEILHDQLLGLFDASNRREKFQPYEVLVMMPDLDAACPVIDAVFGQYDKYDERFIPYAIAEQSLLGAHPLIDSLKWLINMGSSRCQLSDLLTVLRTPCIAHQFGLKDNDFEQLEFWLKDSGMRWGLHSEQKANLGFSDSEELNTILFGIRRMLLGYTNAEQSPIEFKLQGLEISPLSSVAGLDAEVVGCFVSFVEVICNWWANSQEAKSPQKWFHDFSELMTNLIKVEALDDMKVLQALTQALNKFQEMTREASFDEPVSLKVAGSVWLDALKVNDKRQRVLSSGVTFGSMKTMTSVPFKVVCLLGMNDGEFPRLGVHNPFDLMEKKGQSRVGDRSKSHDDRALMLQALLCAREKLYISWSAFNDRDNSAKSPSVLVTQLRQYIGAKWGDDFLASLTSVHPMQAFSEAYFKKGSPLRTYAKEWFAMHLNWAQAHHDEPVNSMNTTQDLERLNDAKHLEPSSSQQEVECSFNSLIMALKNPVKDYFRQALSIDFQELSEDQFDDETFGLDGLEIYQLKDRLLENWSTRSKPYERVDQLESYVKSYLKELQLTGKMPLGPMGVLLQKSLNEEMLPQMRLALKLRELYPFECPELEVNFALGATLFADAIPGLRSAKDGNTGHAKLHMELLASRLIGPKEVRIHHFLRPWILSLVFAHLGVDVRLMFLYADAVLQVELPSQELATQSLMALADVYEKSRKIFLPMPLKTALVYAKDHDAEKARSVYEGNDHSSGEVDDMSLERIYPNFDLLTRDLNTLDVWIQTYEPFWTWYASQPKPKRYQEMELDWAKLQVSAL